MHASALHRHGRDVERRFLALGWGRSRGSAVGRSYMLLGCNACVGIHLDEFPLCTLRYHVKFVRTIAWDLPSSPSHHIKLTVAAEQGRFT
jgi:hypothetical protein